MFTTTGTEQSGPPAHPVGYDLRASGYILSRFHPRVTCGGHRGGVMLVYYPLPNVALSPVLLAVVGGALGGLVNAV